MKRARKVKYSNKSFAAESHTHIVLVGLAQRKKYFLPEKATDKYYIVIDIRLLTLKWINKLQARFAVGLSSIQDKLKTC